MIIYEIPYVGPGNPEVNPSANGTSSVFFPYGDDKA